MAAADPQPPHLRLRAGKIETRSRLADHIGVIPLFRPVLGGNLWPHGNPLVVQRVHLQSHDGFKMPQRTPVGTLKR